MYIYCQTYVMALQTPVERSVLMCLRPLVFYLSSLWNANDEKKECYTYRGHESHATVTTQTGKFIYKPRDNSFDEDHLRKKRTSVKSSSHRSIYVCALKGDLNTWKKTNIIQQSVTTRNHRCAPRIKTSIKHIIKAGLSDRRCVIQVDTET